MSIDNYIKQIVEKRLYIAEHYGYKELLRIENLINNYPYYERLDLLNREIENNKQKNIVIS